MTKIGQVKYAHPLHGDIIVSVELDKDMDPIIKPGIHVRFEHAGDTIVSGSKFWPENRNMDLLIRKPSSKPVVGEKVFLQEN